MSTKTKSLAIPEMAGLHGSSLRNRTCALLWGSRNRCTWRLCCRWPGILCLRGPPCPRSRKVSQNCSQSPVWHPAGHQCRPAGGTCERGCAWECMSGCVLSRQVQKQQYQQPPPPLSGRFIAGPAGLQPPALAASPCTGSWLARWVQPGRMERRWCNQHPGCCPLGCCGTPAQQGIDRLRGAARRTPGVWDTSCQQGRPPATYTFN